MELAAHSAVPTIYFFRAFAEAGGLMSYGTSLTDAYRLAGVYTGRRSQGRKALPSARRSSSESVKVELCHNLKTAKTLGLCFSMTLLGRADEVIE